MAPRIVDALLAKNWGKEAFMGKRNFSEFQA